MDIIFQEKNKTSQVHPNWERIMGYCGVWSDFIVHDRFMTVSRYNFAGKFYEVSAVTDDVNIMNLKYFITLKQPNFQGRVDPLKTLAFIIKRVGPR